MKKPLEARILENLSQVLDPETGLNVVRMGLVESLQIDEASGDVRLVFRPTSFFCPLAFRLAVDMKHAVQETCGVKSATVVVENFARAHELNQLLDGERHRPEKTD
jgi:metal-sulfur cluster biosynthetic enzyme